MMTTFTEYQVFCHETAVYHEETALSYLTLGLVGEAGEIANKVKKIYRDKGGEITDAEAQELALELGDTLWYMSELCTLLGVNLGSVAEANIHKLRSRVERGTLQGSGDHR
jgi:NTP pyrophosphatase (non-canonical NTP hydrolase)